MINLFEIINSKDTTATDLSPWHFPSEVYKILRDIVGNNTLHIRTGIFLNNDPISQELTLLLGYLNHNIDLSTVNEIYNIVNIINDYYDLKDKIEDTLENLFKIGPLHDGDLPSKAQRDLLLNNGYVTKIVVNGEDGFNALNHIGKYLYKVMMFYKEHPEYK